MSGYISNGVTVFLHWLCFATIKLLRYLSEFKMKGIGEYGLLLSSNAVSHEVRKSEKKCVEPPPHSGSVQNFTGVSLVRAAACHQISRKLDWQVFAISLQMN